jgi:hypothetical protein
MADILQITDQVGRGIAVELSMGKRTPCTSLIDKNKPVLVGIKKGAVISPAAGTRSTVQEHDGHSGGTPAFFHIDLMLIPFELMDRVGFDFGVKNSHDRLRSGRNLDLA